MLEYYPKAAEKSVGQLNREFPDWNLVDPKEVVRLNDIEERKKRGKGAPKKAKSKSTLSLFPCSVLHIY